MNGHSKSIEVSDTGGWPRMGNPDFPAAQWGDGAQDRVSAIQSAIQLPWTSDSVPHAVLDILRGCNIRCRACYNSRPAQIRSLAEIERQLDALMRLRQLQTVSVVGGEITLHPDLVEIVRRIRRRGLFAQLFTNGLGLNDTLLDQLKQAGANAIFLHIEAQQRRADLPPRAATDELRRLRAEKAALVAAHGIEPGLSITAYPDKPEEIEEAIAFTLESPHLCYLLATWWRDTSRMPALAGDLASGLVADASRDLPAPQEPAAQELCQWLEQRFGLAPFTTLASNLDRQAVRWLSCVVATAHRAGEPTGQRCLHPTWFERVFMALSKSLSGRYPFYQKQGAPRTGLHLLLNGLAGGGWTRNLRLLARAGQPGNQFHTKRILFQWPASIDSAGRVVHCLHCPDAVLKDGHLVPLCLSDKMATRVGAESSGAPALVL
jgi:hypothetical protein